MIGSRVVFGWRARRRCIGFVDDEGEVEGLIDDNPIEEEEEDDAVSENEEDSVANIGKRKKRLEDEYDRLDDDDYDLIEENLKIKVRRES